MIDCGGMNARRSVHKDTDRQRVQPCSFIPAPMLQSDSVHTVTVTHRHRHALKEKWAEGWGLERETKPTNGCKGGVSRRRHLHMTPLNHSRHSQGPSLSVMAYECSCVQGAEEDVGSKTFVVQFKQGTGTRKVRNGWRDPVMVVNFSVFRNSTGCGRY